MNTYHLVKHPKYSPADLHGKRLGWFHSGTDCPWSLEVRNQNADGRYELAALHTKVDQSGPAIPEQREQISFLEERLDQSTVDRIEAAVSVLLSPCYDFVLFEGHPGSPEMNRPARTGSGRE